MRADTGLRIDEHCLSNGGAQRSRGGEVWRPAICLSGARLALECPPRFRAHLAHRAPRCLDREQLRWSSDISGGLDQLGRLVSGRFRGIIWWSWWGWQHQIYTILWISDGQQPCVDSQEVLCPSSLWSRGQWRALQQCQVCAMV